MPTIHIQLLRQWDATLLRTQAFTPAQSASALLDWHHEPPLDEEGLPAELATALAGALLEHGTVAGRWFDRSPLPPGSTLYDFKPTNPLQRLTDRLQSTQPQPVITTTTISGVCKLLDRGWGVQQQALLVFEPIPYIPYKDVLETLSRYWDWTAFTFPPPTRALIAPGNDGDCILIATPSEQQLTLFLNSIVGSFRKSGFTVQP